MMQATLFGAPGEEIDEPRKPRADALETPLKTYGHRERLALRKISSPARFHFFKWQALNDLNRGPKDCMLTGCVVTRLLTKGKRKGEPCYDEPTIRVVVTEAELNAELARYERETGNCHKCEGSGQEWAGWGIDTGTKHRTCARCKGDGKAPPDTLAESEGR